MEKNIQRYQQKVNVLSNQQDYSFEIMLKSWMDSPFSVRHPEIMKILTLGALVPPSTAEVERSFGLMKPICRKLRNRLLTENLSHCMRICKFRDITEEE